MSDNVPQNKIIGIFIYMGKDITGQNRKVECSVKWLLTNFLYVGSTFYDEMIMKCFNLSIYPLSDIRYLWHKTRLLSADISTGNKYVHNTEYFQGSWNLSSSWSSILVLTI